MLMTSVIPKRLQSISQPPTKLYIRGADLHQLLRQPTLAVVGSRHISAYGAAVTTRLVSELARAGVVIISGLALGVDAIAHRAALDAGGLTVAVMPCGLDRIYPASHQQLARRIVEQDGALISEYPPGEPPLKWTFIARNRLVSGLGDAVLITEAGEKSGTLHTARFALEQGKDVLAVPGEITSPTSVGTNRLIQTGAALVSSADDILNILGLHTQQSDSAQHKPSGNTPDEQILIDLLWEGLRDGSTLLARSQLGVVRFNQSLTMLELQGVVRALGADQWALH